MGERERRKRTEERTHKESAGFDSLCKCVCLLRSYVFALETLALDVPWRERRKLVFSFLFYTKSSSKFELILVFLYINP